MHEHSDQYSLLCIHWAENIKINLTRPPPEFKVAMHLFSQTLKDFPPSLSSFCMLHAGHHSVIGLNKSLCISSFPVLSNIYRLKPKK